MNVDVKKTKDEHNANRRLKYASPDPQVAKQARLQRNERDRKVYATRDPYMQNKCF